VPPVCPNVTLNLTGRILPSKDACEEDQGVYKSLHICSSPWRPRRHREIAIFDPVLTILSFSSTPGARPSPPAAPSRARRPPRAESCCGEAGREVRLGGECRRLLAAARGGREGLRELIVFFFSFFFPSYSARIRFCFVTAGPWPKMSDVVSRVEGSSRNRQGSRLLWIQARHTSHQETTPMLSSRSSTMFVSTKTNFSKSRSKTRPG